MSKNASIPTRAPARAVPTDQRAVLPVRKKWTDTPEILITRQHQFFGMFADEKRDKLVARCRALVYDMTPANERLLTAIRRALFVSYSPEHGFKFRNAVTRYEIGRVLGRPGDGALNPYDLRQLAALVDSGLVNIRRRALPQRKMTGADGTILRLGAGFEYQYQIESETLFALLTLDGDGQRQLEAIKNWRPAPPPEPSPGYLEAYQRARAAAAADTPSPSKSPKVAAPPKVVKKRPETFYYHQPSLWDRILALFGL